MKVILISVALLLLINGIFCNTGVEISPVEDDYLCVPVLNGWEHAIGQLQQVAQDAGVEFFTGDVATQYNDGSKTLCRGVEKEYAHLLQEYDVPPPAMHLPARTLTKVTRSADALDVARYSKEFELLAKDVQELGDEELIEHMQNSGRTLCFQNFETEGIVEVGFGYVSKNEE